jgi:uncharacterized protein YabN with tetrapyrrole methylase and pyrophosphatase domain
VRSVTVTRARGYLHLVGVGPSDEDALSIGARKAIDAAEELWMLDLGPPNYEREFLRKYLDRARKVVNLSGHYHIPECTRTTFYVSISHRLLHLVRRGRRITFLVSGNPLLWTSVTDFFKQWTDLVDVRITPSMSFLDIMNLRTPFAVDTLQVRLSTITEPDISPTIDCVIGQIGDDHTTRLFGQTGSVRLLSRDLRRFYPANHEVYLFGHHSVDGEPKFRKVTVGRLPSVLKEFEGWHFSALIPAKGRSKRRPPFHDANGLFRPPRRPLRDRERRL